MKSLRESLSRYKLAYILAVLIVLNAFRFWPRKKPDTVRDLPPPPPRSAVSGASPGQGFPPGGPGGRPDSERMEAMLKALPEEKRKIAEERMSADRQFFNFIKDLPEDQRRQTMEEHFAQNPPPFPPTGVDGAPMPSLGGGGGAGARGPGLDPFSNGGGMHLPPPEVRRSMDAQIANAQKKGNP